MIGDPTEMPRPDAQKTEYVGKLSDGHSFHSLVLPFRTFV
jgi:hypothetical protein